MATPLTAVTDATYLNINNYYYIYIILVIIL